MSGSTRGGSVLRAAVWLVRLLLAAFFAFVGFMKATAPMVDLERYHAWVAHLSPVIARSVGISELLCALGLLLPRLPSTRIDPGPIAALILAVNQVFAIAFHAQRGELAQSLPQNMALIALAAFVWLVGRRQRATRTA